MPARRPLSVLAIIVLTGACGTPSGPSADMVLTNGQVRTPDGWVEAVAVADGSIVAVGSAAALQDRVGPQTEVVDLDGRTVLPGFHDMHVHPVYGGIMYSGADYTNCRIEQGADEAQLLATVAECASRVSDGEWITGGQWDASALGGVPHRSTLDRVSQGRPIVINDTSGHSVWANTAALELAGITADTPDPPGGIIERDANGEPTGVFRESANGLIRMHVPPPSPEIVQASLEWSLQTMLEQGITSFTVASVGFVGGQSTELDAWVGFASDGVLKQRVRLCRGWSPGFVELGAFVDSLNAGRERFEREGLSLDCVKIFLDGVPTDSHTAAMLEPYADAMEGRDDDASRYGMLLIDQPTLDEGVTAFDAADYTVKFHAAGDAAVRAGLNAVEAARSNNGMSDRRHDVGHCTFISREDLDRATAINATFELSPYLWAPSPINDDITKAIGQERIERVWPFRDVIDAGALVVPGSDWSVVPSVNPWIAIETLVTRQEAGGSDRAFGPGQAITVGEAVDLFTVNSAAHMGNQASLGQIATGMLADLIVLNQNPYEVEATDLHRTSVDMTIINGETVFERGAGQP